MNEHADLAQRAQALSGKLGESADRLNASLRDAEEVFIGKQPGFVWVPEIGQALVWDGSQLLCDDGQHRVHLPNAPLRQRVKAVYLLRDLYDKLPDI